MRLDADDLATCLDELGWLSKREGFIQRRLAQAPIVDELLRGSIEDSFERMRHRFVSAINSVPEEQAALLLDVYGLSEEMVGVTQLLERRKIHGQKIGRKVDTVRTREEAAIKLLYSRLVSGRYAQAPLVLDVPEMHGGIIYEETNTLVIVRDRHWQVTHEHYRFANMGGLLDYVDMGRSYPANVTVHPLSPFEVVTKAINGGGWSDQFWHIDNKLEVREKMQDQSRYDLRFRITPPREDDQEARPMIVSSRAFHTRSLLATIRVGFVGEQPRSIWKFQGASPFAIPDIADPDDAVGLDVYNSATLTLRDLHGGLFSGFVWKW